jgi:hypothetical protein
VRNGKYTFADGENTTRFHIVAGTGKIISPSQDLYGEMITGKDTQGKMFDEDYWKEEEQEEASLDEI